MEPTFSSRGNCSPVEESFGAANQREKSADFIELLFNQLKGQISLLTSSSRKFMLSLGESI
jgi:hypothetical protein